MSYPYSFNYIKDNEVAGYSGPSPLAISNDEYASGIVNPLDSRVLIQASIQRILMVSPGERVMQPEFGMNLRKLLFEPLDLMLINDIKEHIIMALTQQEPRIVLQDLDFEINEEQHTISISIQYRYKRTGLEDSFNFVIR